MYVLEQQAKWDRIIRIYLWRLNSTAHKLLLSFFHKIKKPQLEGATLKYASKFVV